MADTDDGHAGKEETAHDDEQGVPEEDREESTEEHLLRHNDDYQHVLAACAVLENQLKQCKKDIERLRWLKRRALEEPVGYIENLRNGTVERAPVAQRIVAIPDIDLAKYTSRGLSTRGPRLQMRFVAAPMYKNYVPIANDSSTLTPVDGATTEVEARNQENSSAQGNSEADERLNYKVPWTEDEQRQLEELLVVFSDETVQVKKFEKIANAMGTRTAAQVSSRVQKYFAKLEQAGLSVPGRRQLAFSCSTNHFPITPWTQEVTPPSHDLSRWSGAHYARTVLPEMADAASDVAVSRQQDPEVSETGQNG